MVRLFVIGCTIVGAAALIGWVAPSVWSTGFNLPIGNGIQVAWAYCLLGLAGYSAYKITD